MSEAKPFATCSVYKDDVTMDHEDIYLDHIIKTEEVDLEPDYIECDTDVYREITDLDGQTKLQCNHDDSEIYHNTKIKTEIKPEIVTNDALEPLSLQKIPSDLNMEIKIEEMDESDIVSETNVAQMSEAKPFATCSVYKDHVMMDHDYTCLDQVIKTEELDLEPDYIECDTDVYREITDMDEQTKLQYNHDDSEIYHSTEKKTEIKPEIVTNDALEPLSLQEIPSDLNTEIKIEEMDESDTDVRMGDEKIYLMEASSVQIESKAGVSKTSDGKRKQQPKVYICNECSHKCVKRSTIIKHLNAHTCEKPFSCEYCEFKSRRKYDLKIHLRLHTGEKPFSCNICDYVSAQKVHLTQHLRTHTGEKPFQCDFCEYRCGSKSDLNRHSKTHTGEKPYSCNFCDYKSALKSSLNSHILIHTGERPHSCNFCDFKCTRKFVLNKHFKTHTGEKPFSCNFCDYKCSAKSSLTSHIRIHTGEKPYSCNFCDYKSAVKSNLNKHSRKQHSDNNKNDNDKKRMIIIRPS